MCAEIFLKGRKHIDIAFVSAVHLILHVKIAGPTHVPSIIARFPG